MPPALLSRLLQGKRGERAVSRTRRISVGALSLGVPFLNSYLSVSQDRKAGKDPRPQNTVEKGNGSYPGYSPAAV